MSDSAPPDFPRESSSLSDDDLRLLINAVHDYAIYTLTPQGHIRSWNPGAQRLHGFTPDEAIGQFFGILYPTDGIDVGSTAFQLNFASEHGRYERDGWQVRKDGSRFWAHSLTTPLRGPDGQLRGFAKITQDITQRKQAEDELRESHTYIEQVIRSAQEGIVVYDNELRYRVFNPYMERFTGLSEKDVLGHQPLEFFPFLTKFGVDLVHQRALHGETLESEPIRFKLGADRDGWSSGVWSPLRDSQGKIIGALGFVRDITERINTQERLQMLSRRLLTAQEQERRHLAIELHDEVGQVLTAVTLNLKSLLKDASASGREQVQECMQVVHEAIQTVRKLSLNLRPSLLDDLGLEPALRWLLDQQSQRANFEFTLVCEIPKGLVHSDLETACFRIVQESVTNIVRHAHAHHVSVEVQCDPVQLRLTIRDDGAGFDMSAAQQRSVQGQSCGLLGMAERAQLLGGEFRIESANGQGTLVTAVFPRTGDPPNPGNGKPAPNTNSLSSPQSSRSHD